MEKEKDTRKRITPPYLSVTKLEELLDLASNRNYPAYSSEIFKKQGFNDSDASWSVNALKFLGLIDDLGVPTQLMQKLRLTGDLRTAEVEKIVRAAYSPLFETAGQPEQLPMDQLMNEFVIQYGMTRRLAESAARVFAKLCEIAGLKEPGSVAPRKQSPRAEKDRSSQPKLSNRRPPAQHEEGIVPAESFVRVADGRLVLGLPKSIKERLLDDEAVEEDWRTLRSALKTFADIYIPKEKQHSLEETSP